MWKANCRGEAWCGEAKSGVFCGEVHLVQS